MFQLDCARVSGSSRDIPSRSKGMFPTSWDVKETKAPAKLRDVAQPLEDISVMTFDKHVKIHFPTDLKYFDLLNSALFLM